MGYESQFLEARKGYHQKIQTFQPSKTLMAIIDEDKPKQLAHKLDETKSKPFRQMDEALNVFDAYRLAYIKKITNQIAHESQAAKIKPTINFLMAKMEKLIDDYQKECEKKRKDELAEAKKKQEAEKAEKAKEQAAEDKAEAQELKGDLAKISAAFQRRGEAYHMFVLNVEKECQKVNKAIGMGHDRLHSAADLLGKMEKSGKVAEVRIMTEKASAKATMETLRRLLKSEQKIFAALKPREKDAKLTPKEVADDLHLKLPDTARKDLENIAKQHGNILENAGIMAENLALQLKSDTRKLAEAEKLLAQINAFSADKAAAKTV